MLDGTGGRWEEKRGEWNLRGGSIMSWSVGERDATFVGNERHRRVSEIGNTLH